MHRNETTISNGKPRDSVSLEGVDYIEFYVGNPKQAAHFYQTMLNMAPIGYAGLETGLRNKASYILALGDIYFMFTGSLVPDDSIAWQVNLHGDFVRDIAFTVGDAEQAFNTAIERGAQAVLEPTLVEDDQGRLIKATIASCGDLVHSFIQRSSHRSIFPGYKPIAAITGANASGLTAIDHVAISAQSGTLDRWVDFYQKVFGFHESHREVVETSSTGMNSKVVQNESGSIRIPIVEPLPAKCKSQIDEYLEFHRGPGPQHVALQSNSIIETTEKLQANGLEFLYTPGAYYDTLLDRVGPLDENLDDLRQANILVDRDEWGYLMQIFSKHAQSRPTFFLEVIQRKGARGFGSGNIKALFEAVEREQAIRRNL